jgi:hypothetical protein
MKKLSSKQMITMSELPVYPVEKDILPDLPWKFENPEKQATQKAVIYYFALTTCAHCKLGLKWLQERGAAVQWMYLDELSFEKKQPIKVWVKARYNTNFGTPFVIFRIDGKDFTSEGFDPDYWKSKVR